MEDREQKLTEHIAELRKRLKRVVIALASVTLVILFFSPTIIKIFWQEIVGKQMFVFGVMEWILLNLIFSLILGLIVVYPYASFELYMFAKPGLYSNERRFLKLALIATYILFILGIFLALRFIVPALYSLSYGEEFYSAERTITSALKIAFIFAFSLQIPLAIFLLDIFGVVKYETMKSFRIPIYVISILVIFNSPIDISGFTQIASMLTFILMFELGLALLGLSKRYIKWGKNKS
ncbi:MAG: hypothetical protein HA490_00820 [Archaeoglobales archaeon]|nr:hypothetical protein [Archaeoglobales archaeon]